MTKRCRHELETKDGYPDDIICLKCQTIWHISEYMNWSVDKLRQYAPKFIQKAVLDRRTELYRNYDR